LYLCQELDETLSINVGLSEDLARQEALAKTAREELEQIQVRKDLEISVFKS